MLKKQLRLRSEDFLRRPTRVVPLPHFIVKVFKGDTSHNYNRFGVVVSAKTEPRAVRRHLLKRRVMEIVKEWPNMSADFLFVALPRARSASWSELRGELEGFLERTQAVTVK